MFYTICHGIAAFYYLLVWSESVTSISGYNLKIQNNAGKSASSDF